MDISFDVHIGGGGGGKNLRRPEDGYCFFFGQVFASRCFEEEEEIPGHHRGYLINSSSSFLCICRAHASPTWSDHHHHPSTFAFDFPPSPRDPLQNPSPPPILPVLQTPHREEAGRGRMDGWNLGSTAAGGGGKGAEP